MEYRPIVYRFVNRSREFVKKWVVLYLFVTFRRLIFRNRYEGSYVRRGREAELVIVIRDNIYTMFRRYDENNSRYIFGGYEVKKDNHLLDLNWRQMDLLYELLSEIKPLKKRAQ